MAATASLKITKTFPYRGGTREYSNRYHFAGGDPPDSATWTALADDAVAAEAGCLPSSQEIILATGYNAGSDVPVWSKAYTTSGSLTLGTSVATPGEAAALVRYTTDQRTTKNHPIYLFNYYHGARAVSSSDGDSVQGNMKTDLTALAAAWIAGFPTATHEFKRAGPNGAVALTGACETYITHRDFPR